MNNIHSIKSWYPMQVSWLGSSIIFQPNGNFLLSFIYLLSWMEKPFQLNAMSVDYKIKV